MGVWREQGKIAFTPLGQALHDLKYSKMTETKRDALIERLLDQMGPELKRVWSTYPSQYIVPVPSNKKGSRNIPARISRALGMRTALRNRPELLRKTRSLRSVKWTPREKRETALSDAYVATRPLMSERGILIIDDVCDTGTTLRAVNDAFLRVGLAGSLQFLVMAHLSNEEMNWSPIR